MKFYEITGEFEKKGEKRKFSKKVKAESHGFASEKVMCLMGSKHKVKRRDIIIKEVKEMGEANGGTKTN